MGEGQLTAVIPAASPETGGWTGTWGVEKATAETRVQAAARLQGGMSSAANSQACVGTTETICRVRAGATDKRPIARGPSHSDRIQHLDSSRSGRIRLPDSSRNDPPQVEAAAVGEEVECNTTVSACPFPSVGASATLPCIPDRNPPAVGRRLSRRTARPADRSPRGPSWRCRTHGLEAPAFRTQPLRFPNP